MLAGNGKRRHICRGIDVGFVDPNRLRRWAGVAGRIYHRPLVASQPTVSPHPAADNL